MTQSNFFFCPGKGDQESSKQHYVWGVQVFWRGQWCTACDAGFHALRSEARAEARVMRAAGEEVRVVPYKACIDTKGRFNRQILSERLDY